MADALLRVITMNGDKPISRPFCSPPPLTPCEMSLADRPFITLIRSSSLQALFGRRISPDGQTTGSRSSVRGSRELRAPGRVDEKSWEENGAVLGGQCLPGIGQVHRAGSVTASTWLAFTSARRWLLPLGQCTSTTSACAAWPRPKRATCSLSRLG